MEAARGKKTERRGRRERARLLLFHFSLLSSSFRKEQKEKMLVLSSSTPIAASGPYSSSSFLPADRRAARRGLWRDWAQAPEAGSLFAVVDQRGGGVGGSSAAAAVSEWATAWLAASTAESDLTSMLHSEVMVCGKGLGPNEAA